MISGSVAILTVEAEPPADYLAEFTNITMEATVQLGTKESESFTSRNVLTQLKAENSQSKGLWKP